LLLLLPPQLQLLDDIIETNSMHIKRKRFLFSNLAMILSSMLVI
jgi:hypothetical protein